MSDVFWKHIGLHGHSVGTFVCEDKRIVWKSAITGRDDDISSSKTVPADRIKGASWTVFGRSGYLRLQQTATGANKHELRFDGFPAADFETLKSTLKNKYNVDLVTHSMSTAGAHYGLTSVKGKNLVFRHCVLDEMNEEGQEFEPRAEEEMMSIDLAEVTQCVLPGNNRNEIEVQLPESDAVEAGTDQLVAIRFYIPPDPEADVADKEAPTAAELLQQKIMQTANIRKTTGDILVSFEQSKGTFLTPRGRYAIELYEYFFRMRGQKYDYKIKYDDISRLFLLPKPDDVHMAFVIALDKPIRQGQQRYQYLVLQCTKETDEVTINLDEETLQKEYEGELQPVMRGALSNLIAKTFKVIAKKKVFIPGKFANAAQQPSVKCAVRANEGYLYPLEKQFIFIHKPPILIRFNEVQSVEFQRYAGGQGSTRNFDLCVNLKTSVTGGSAKEYVFSGIERADYAGLYNFLSGKKIPIKNLQSDMEEVIASRPVYNEDELLGPDDGVASDSEDEDFDEAAAQREEDQAEDSDEDSIDDDELGSEVDEDLDSDLEDVRKESKKKKKRPAAADDDGDDDGDEPVKKSPKKKKQKDPAAPKRAKTAYFYFMDENRDRIKKENPDASFSDVGKLLGEAWRNLDDKEKSRYEKMASTDKERYKDEMKDYSPPPATKEKGKKKKDPNEPKRGMSSFMYFSNEVRPKIKKEHPEMSFGELGKKIGEMFRELSPEEKLKYEEMAKKDKARYQREIAAYKNKKSGNAGDEEDEDDVRREPDDDDDDDALEDDDDDNDDDDED